jgi:probable F420-dependent oxidoreductase
VTAFDGRSGPKIGLFADCTDESMPILDLAQALTERGFTGLFLNEHPHMPVEHSRSEFPAGGPIPGRYARFWCPFTALSFVAAQTDLDVGTCISLVGEHDAIALAKSIATLDALSEGRFVLGVGFGWHREEFEDHGHPAEVRARVVEETVRAMRALWTEEVASFSGEYVRLSPSWSWPKPHQKPHPPVLLGTRGTTRNFKRMAAWCDGWIPMGTPDLAGGGFRRELDELRREWEAAGRDPATIRLTVTLTTVRRSELAKAIEQAHDHGAERVLLKIRDEGADEVLPRLDSYAEIAAKAIGAR